MQIPKSVLYPVVLGFEDNKRATFAGSLIELVAPLIARLGSKEKKIARATLLRIM